MSLSIIPISLKEANNFVEELHRHHSKVQGHKFSIGCKDGDKLVGVCIVGRPVSRYLDDGNTLEVTRLCTDGTYNACSILYGRAARIDTSSNVVVSGKRKISDRKENALEQRIELIGNGRIGS